MLPGQGTADDVRIEVRPLPDGSPPRQFEPVDQDQRYAIRPFVARYAAVWTYAVVGEEMSRDYYRMMHDLAAERIDPSGGGVLDVGCGPGMILADLARSFPAVRFTGVDRSTVMIDLARRVVCAPPTSTVELDASDYGFAPSRMSGLGLTNVRLRHCSLEDLAGSERHQLVVASHLLDRVPNPSGGLDALLDLVATGGSILLSCAFSYESRQQWNALPSSAALVSRIENRGFVVDHLDDHVPYREQLDVRGTWTQHRVLVVRAVRGG